LVNQLLKAPAGIDFNTFIDRLAIYNPAFLFLNFADNFFALGIDTQ